MVGALVKGKQESLDEPGHSGGCGRWDDDCIWCVCSGVSGYPLSGAVIQLVRMQEGWFEVEISF